MRLNERNYAPTYSITGLLLAALLLCAGCGSGTAPSPSDSADRSALHHRDGHGDGGGGGGGGGGGKPGGGDPPPPADPAIVYSAAGGNKGGLKVMNADGSNKTKVYSNYVYYPSWSPDGEKIVFTNPTSSNALYAINLDGSGLFEVVGYNSGSGIDIVRYPEWSPAPVPNRGDRIAFTGNVDRAL